MDKSFYQHVSICRIENTPKSEKITKIVPDTKQTLLTKLPKTFEISPNWSIFAQSGRTEFAASFSLSL